MHQALDGLASAGAAPPAPTLQHPASAALCTMDSTRADAFAAFAAGVARRAPPRAPAEVDMRGRAARTIAAERASPTPHASLDAPFTAEEVELGLRRLKHRKAAGLDGLPAELL